jgi:Fe-S cluster assembly protein SufB
MINNEMQDFNINRSDYDRINKEKLKFRSDLGLNEEVVRLISKDKNEPTWMLNKRLEALKIFFELKMPKWGPDLTDLDLSKIHYYLKPDAKKNARSWSDVPKEIRETYERLGIPTAERDMLAGVGAQYESEVVYHNLRKELQAQGVIFLDCDEALQKYPQMFKKYFMNSCTSSSLHKFVALHAAVWSGGTFIYIPKNVKIAAPLQAYFRMNAKKAGQFEHTLIIADEGSEISYIEGCSAPQYVENSLHAGCVEIHVLKNAKVHYYSIENWSKNTYNLNTKRALVQESGSIDWISGNLGSGRTMLYPSSILLGDKSKSNYVGIAFAGKGQNQDTGCKVIQVGKGTSSTITSKSISKEGGIASYRGLVSIKERAVQSSVSVVCDALLMDSSSKSNTYPAMDIKNNSAQVGHEATVGKINEEEIFYLMSRGLDEETATKMIVLGFMEPVTKKLPLEYAVELNRLIELEMEGSVG